MGKYYLLFLLLKVVTLDAFLTWNGFGTEYVKKKLLRIGEESNSTAYIEKWIEQRLDNFDNQEKRTWQMRYYENFEHFQPSGPIYLLIGGEWNVDESLRFVKFLDDLVSETHGAVFLTEHRYYGESMPLNSAVTENLKYLSSEQALADLAHLVKSIKLQPNFESSKVVAVGGSYAGNLAAWMRTIYPDIVDCAWASSAPVLAKKDFVEYLEQTGEDYMKYGGNQCYEKIAQIYSRFHELFQTSEGITELKQEYNICEETDMTKPLNKALFVDTMLSKLVQTAQYGTPDDLINTCNELTIGTDISIILNDKNFIGVPEIKSKSNQGCQNFEFNNQNTLMRSWMYQTCTEFGYYQTTDSNNQPFSKDIILDFYTETCSLFFGPDFNEVRIDKGVAYTNKLYGGLSPNVTKVVFVYGSIDPWHRLGITKSLSDDVLAVLIDGTSHCRDMTSYDPSEPEQLTKARQYAKNAIRHWLGLGHAPSRNSYSIKKD